MNEIVVEVVPSGLMILLLLLIYGRLVHISKLLKK
jgi:hypothetical protein